MALLLDLFLSFFKIGLFTVGGAYSMIPLMEAELIRVHGWFSAEGFIDIVAISEMTPGPISINIATFTGYQVAGVPGSLIATFGVISPSLFLLLLFSRLLFNLVRQPAAKGALLGMRSALVALIVFASYTLGQSALIDLPSGLIFTFLFAASLLRPIHPLYLILAGALAGLLLFSYQ